MTEICPGPCNAGYRRAQTAHKTAVAEWQAAEKAAADWRKLVRDEGQVGPEPPRWDQPEPPKTRAWPGEPIWCSRCTASLRRCLSELEELLDLRVTMTDGYQTAGEQLVGNVHGKKQAAASPSPGIDDLDDALRWLYGWEDALRDTQGWPARPYRGVNAPALTTTLAWFGERRFDMLLAHPDLAEPFGTELFREHARLQQVTRTRPPAKLKPLPCPRCRKRALFLHDDETIRCHNDKDDCKRVMSQKEYSEMEDEADRQVAS